MLANINEKINSKVKEIEKDPQKILTENMSGKMEGCKSISTSSATNATCQKRIIAALNEIRDYSAESAELLARFCLPSTDKKHITQKQLVKELEKIGCTIPVCAFCYSYRDLNGSGIISENKNIKFSANGRYLSEKLRDYNELPIVIGFYGFDGKRHERLEAFGDTENETQARNYLRLCNKPENKEVLFTVWTKNPEHYYKAILAENGKPENLKIILSSYRVNIPDIKTAVRYNELYPGMIDSVFTVWTENGAKHNNITLNCCGSEKDKIIPRKCLNCMNCYLKDGNAETVLLFATHPEIQAVNEILR